MQQQFFVSSLLKEDINNGVAEALRLRIARAHRQNQNFKVIVVMPLLPSFSGYTAIKQIKNSYIALVKVIHVAPVKVIHVAPVKVIHVAPVKIIHVAPVKIIHVAPVKVIHIAPVKPNILKQCSMQMLLCLTAHDVCSPVIRRI